jgi:acyl-CoA dehydrogenase
METQAQRWWRDLRLLGFLVDRSGTLDTGSIALGPFTAEHHRIRQGVRSFVETELRPNAQTWEREERFPREIFKLAADEGLLGHKFPPDVGGSGPDIVAEAVVTEELVRAASGGVSAGLGAHKDLACLYVFNFGTPEQHERWLKPSLAGELIGALGVTEADAGSDVNALRTTATRNGDGWILNGSKMFITNGAWADYVVIAAKTDNDAGHGGVTLFVVETDTPGYESRRMQMLGWRPSQTGDITLTDVAVPDSHRLGAEGSGFYAIMQNFAWERLSMALGQTAGATLVLEEAMKVASPSQAVRLTDMRVQLEAARALAYAALRDHAAGEDALQRVAMAKLITSELAFEIANECLGTPGLAGYLMGAAAQRAWRDSRLGPIGGGTSQIMREIIARTFGI